MDYFPILFDPPLKCCYVGLWGETHGDTPSLPPLALPLHIGWCSRQASWGALPFPSQEPCPWCRWCGWDLPTRLFLAAVCRREFSLQAKWKSWGQLLNECPCSSYPPHKSCPVALVEGWLGCSCGLCARFGLGWRWSVSFSFWSPSRVSPV